MKSAMSNTTYAKAASLLLLELAVTSTVAVHSPAASDRRRLEAVCTRVTPEHTALESIDDIALHTPFVMESSTSFTFELTNVSSMFTRFTMTLKGRRSEHGDLEIRRTDRYSRDMSGLSSGQL